jgi:hypothetical protein
MKLKISYLFTLCIFSCAFGQHLLSEEVNFEETPVEEAKPEKTPAEKSCFDVTPIEEENPEKTPAEESCFNVTPIEEVSPEKIPAEETNFDIVPDAETNFEITPAEEPKIDVPFFEEANVEETFEEEKFDITPAEETNVEKMDEEEPSPDTALVEEENLELKFADEAGSDEDLDLIPTEKDSFDRTLANELLLPADQLVYIECNFIPMPPSSESNKRRQLQNLSHSSNVPKNQDRLGLKFSNNWCGYVACSNFAIPTVGSVSSVSALWLVPTLSPVPQDAFSAAWIGMDGFLNGTIEQIGTRHDWTSGTQNDYAWFQMHPNQAFIINGFPLNPGDLVGAISQHVGNGVFQLSIYNYTHGVFTFIPTELTTNPRAKRITAKWIVEAPAAGKGLSLANFDTIPMVNCKATINGVLGPINNPMWQNKQIHMHQGVPKTSPTPLNPTGDGFIHIWKHT